MIKNPVLIIRLNDNPISNFCPLCETETIPNIGAEIFLKDADRVVCLNCAEIHAPILAALITFADLARLFQMAENNFGEVWEKKQFFKGSPMNKYQSFGIQKAEAKTNAS